MASSYFTNRIIPFTYLLIIGFSFFHFYTQVFDKKIHLGGDNAGYYILGKSLASGHGYSNIHTQTAKSHNHFSPGYPAIIATSILLFSDDVQVIKKMNGLFLILTLGILFFLIYHITNNYHLAFITSLFTLLNYHVLNYSMIMMSEIPFLFFSSLTLFLFLKTNFELPILKNWNFWLLLLSTIISYYIRPTGIALVTGVGVLLAIQKKWNYLWVTISSFLLFILPWLVRSKNLGGSSYLKQLTKVNPYQPELGDLTLTDWFTRIWDNLERYITREIPSGIFNFIEVLDHKLDVSYQEWVLGFFILSIGFLGLFQLKEKSMVLCTYIISTFGILLLWPPVWYGPRFLLPLIPLLLFLFISGTMKILTVTTSFLFKNPNPNLVYGFLSACSIFYGLKSYTIPLQNLHLISSEKYSPPYENYFEIAEWVNLNTPDSSITCCRKEQLFYIHSQKKVTRFKNTLNREEQVDFLKETGADFVVLEQLGYADTDRYLYPVVKRYPNKFKVIKHIKNPDTYLLKFSPDLGYTGEWKNNQRSGYGTFVWESGLSFAGNWKNNVRNGTGTLYFSNGNYLEGTWVNDKLHGETISRSASGTIIEHALYNKNKKVKIFTVK